MEIDVEKLVLWALAAIEFCDKSHRLFATQTCHREECLLSRALIVEHERAEKLMAKAGS